MALYRASASSTVLSSFDVSTALTAASNAFASALTVFTALPAFVAAASRPAALDASHLTMTGSFALAALTSVSTVFASFTLFTSVFNAATVSSAPSSALYAFTALDWSATADRHAWRATDT